MASTDLDGSKIVILSEFDAKIVLGMIDSLEKAAYATEYEKALGEKIERALRD